MNHMAAIMLQLLVTAISLAVVVDSSNQAYLATNTNTETDTVDSAPLYLDLPAVDRKFNERIAPSLSRVLNYLSRIDDTKTQSADQKDASIKVWLKKNKQLLGTDEEDNFSPYAKFFSNSNQLPNDKSKRLFRENLSWFPFNKPNRELNLGQYMNDDEFNYYPQTVKADRYNRASPTQYFSQKDRANVGINSKRVENSRWNNLRGMWGKRSWSMTNPESDNTAEAV